MPSTDHANINLTEQVTVKYSKTPEATTQMQSQRVPSSIMFCQKYQLWIFYNEIVSTIYKYFFVKINNTLTVLHLTCY